MARSARTDVGDIPYHVINRAVGRLKIFHTPKDYELFLELLKKSRFECNMRLLAYTLMPNHWHLVVYPQNDGDLGLFMHYLTNAHTRKVHTMTKTIGHGPLYQGRYKSFMIENDKHLLTVMKYVERNPVRAKLSRSCEGWRWGSAWLRKYGTKEQREILSVPPVDLPRSYLSWINESDKEEEIEQLRKSVTRGAPFGTASWTDMMVKEHELQSTVRVPGRPKKSKEITK